MNVLLLQWINALRDILLSIRGSLHYGLVCLMILPKEQHHWYLQSTSKSRLTFSTIVELDLDFLIQLIEATFISSTQQ